MINFLLKQPKVKISQSNMLMTIFFLKPSKSCRGTKRGDSLNSAFVMSCGNKIKTLAYRFSIEYIYIYILIRLKFKKRVLNSIITWTELQEMKYNYTSGHGDMEQEHTRWIRLFPFSMNSSKVPSIGHSNKWVKILTKSPVMRGAVK